MLDVQSEVSSLHDLECCRKAIEYALTWVNNDVIAFTSFVFEFLLQQKSVKHHDVFSESITCVGGSVMYLCQSCLCSFALSIPNMIHRQKQNH